MNWQKTSVQSVGRPDACRIVMENVSWLPSCRCWGSSFSSMSHVSMATLSASASAVTWHAHVHTWRSLRADVMRQTVWTQAAMTTTTGANRWQLKTSFLIVSLVDYKPEVLYSPSSRVLSLIALYVNWTCVHTATACRHVYQLSSTKMAWCTKPLWSDVNKCDTCVTDNSNHLLLMMMMISRRRSNPNPTHNTYTLRTGSREKQSKIYDL